MEAGEALSAEGCSSLGQLIMNLVGKPGGISASSLVEELSSTVPGFSDRGLYQDWDVRFDRNAQALISALHARFAATDARFDFAGMDKLTVDSGGRLHHMPRLSFSKQEPDKHQMPLNLCMLCSLFKKARPQSPH